MRQLTLVRGLTATVADADGPDRHPPVLFVHGMFGGAWMFEGWQRWFAERGWSSTAIDLRGHHGSHPVPDMGRVSVREFADDVIAVAQAMGSPVVIGHSMGGLVAQLVAEAGAAAAAVLLCAAPPRGILVSSPSLIVRQLKHALDILLSRAIVADRADADDLMFNRTPPADRAPIFARFVPESGRAGREISLGAIAVDERRVRCPVLSVVAEDDRFVVPRVGRQLAAKYGARLRAYPGHGHLIIAEAGWETVAGDVLTWLEEVLR